MGTSTRGLNIYIGDGGGNNHLHICQTGRAHQRSEPVPPFVDSPDAVEPHLNDLLLKWRQDETKC